MKWKRVLLSFLLPVALFSRPANEYDFFERKVNRVYYSHEFFHQIFPQKEPFLMKKIAPYFFSYKNSPSLSRVKVALTKDDIYSLKMKLKNEEILYLSYQRESQNKGAIDISTRMEIPSWSKTLSFWIYDEGSGVEGAFYIKTEKGLKRYFFGKVKHVGWKNYLVTLENYKNVSSLSLVKIKFFNRNFPGGANAPKVLLKIGNMEVFSYHSEEKDLNESIKSIPFSKIISAHDPVEKERDSLTINESFHSLYRIQKGFFWGKNEILSFFLKIEQPVILEIYGSLANNRNNIFALQTKVFSNQGNFRLDLMYPAELSKLHSQLEEQGVIFWGFGVIPFEKNNPHLIIERIWIWDQIKNQWKNSSLN